jgi:hypothetical protein
MSAESRIRELVKVHLFDDHKADVVEFVDQLLNLVSEVGEISCALADDHTLRLQVPDQPICDVILGRAKTKLRMACARLGVLCHESGDTEVSLYGGEGVVKKEVSVDSPQTVARASGSGFSSSAASALASPPSLKEWRVRFKNTPSEHEFTIRAIVR